MGIITLSIAAFLTGCAYEENLPETDFTGTVRLTKDALRNLVLLNDDGETVVEDGFATDEDGEFTIDVTDLTQLIGPVYLGAFPSIEDGHFAYPHPEMGPVLDADRPGDTYPYGGTTVGRFDYGCYEQLVCKIVTGRHTDFDEIISFFRDVVDEPVIAPDGSEVQDGATYQEHCFETQNVTSTEELSFIDENSEDDVRPYYKPYFTDKGEYFEANVTIPHTIFEPEMQLWGWVDMPSVKFNFATCDESAGDRYYRYSEQFYQGANFPDVLNFPGTYIDAGDWVAEPYTLEKADDNFVIDLNIHFEG